MLEPGRQGIVDAPDVEAIEQVQLGDTGRGVVGQEHEVLEVSDDARSPWRRSELLVPSFTRYVNRIGPR